MIWFFGFIALILLLKWLASRGKFKQNAAPSHARASETGHHFATDIESASSTEPIPSSSAASASNLNIASDDNVNHESAPHTLMSEITVRLTDDASVTVPLKLTSAIDFEHDEVFASLNRQATQASCNGDMAKAVELLRQAKARQGDAYADTRLALYLQQAGKFDEAMKEFEWLLSHVDGQISLMPDEPPSRRRSLIAFRKEKIHDTARLACQRQGQLDLAGWHQDLSEMLHREARRLQSIADHTDKNRRAKLKTTPTETTNRKG